MRKTPTKVVEKGNNNLKSNVKTAAAILLAVLGITVTASQDVNAQLFAGRDLKKQIAQNNDQLAQNKKVKAQNNETIAEIDEDIEGQNETIAEKTEVRAENNETIAEIDGRLSAKRAQIAELKGKKGDKQPLK